MGSHCLAVKPTAICAADEIPESIEFERDDAVGKGVKIADGYAGVIPLCRSILNLQDSIFKGCIISAFCYFWAIPFFQVYTLFHSSLEILC